jgi:hypothetical protein
MLERLWPVPILKERRKKLTLCKYFYACSYIKLKIEGICITCLFYVELLNSYCGLPYSKKLHGSLSQYLM